MSVRKPRRRLVYFRISEEEYEVFNSLCESTGARSFSDLARSALARMMSKGGNGSEEVLMGQRLEAAEGLVKELNQVLDRLSVLMQGLENGHARESASSSIEAPTER
jgi:hypothetical protein